MFDSLSNRLSETFKSLRGKGRLSAADIDETLRDIRKSLLEADVALDVVKAFIASIRERALGDEVSKALNPAQQVVQIVNSELVKILGSETRRLQFSKNPPTIIMLAGLQGSGKTTFAAKLANLLKNESQTPLLVACDLQRPNAVDQLRVLGEKISVPVFAPEPGSGVGSPVLVAKQAIEKAKREQHAVVIIATAGRTGI
ncbi:MAG: signal recognition particle receptor subunit alpha, partial [Burkholderiaceae bacterium]